MFPYCRQHNAFEGFYCLVCSKLCCKYCEHKTHREHVTMLLQKYNQAIYEENIAKEMEKMSNSKLKIELLQKDIETKGASVSTEEKDFLKFLIQRKNVVTAKCLHLIRHIEKMYQEKYNKIKNHEELSKTFVSYQTDIDRCNDIFEQEEKYNKGSSLEKYFNFNQLLYNIKECNRSLEKVDEESYFFFNFSHVDDKDDEFFFRSLIRLFGVSSNLPETMTESCNDLNIASSYEPNHVFQNKLKNDDEVCSFIRIILEEELQHLSTIGKHFFQFQAKKGKLFNFKLTFKVKMTSALVINFYFFVNLSKFCFPLELDI